MQRSLEQLQYLKKRSLLVWLYQAVSVVAEERWADGRALGLCYRDCSIRRLMVGFVGRQRIQPHHNLQDK